MSETPEFEAALDAIALTAKTSAEELFGHTLTAFIRTYDEHGRLLHAFCTACSRVVAIVRELDDLLIVGTASRLWCKGAAPRERARAWQVGDRFRANLPEASTVFVITDLTETTVRFEDERTRSRAGEIALATFEKRVRRVRAIVPLRDGE